MQAVKDKITVLKKIIEQLDEQKIKYGVGGSLLLFLHGIVDDFHDLDFILDIQNICKVDKILSHMGKKELFTTNNIYKTQVFIEYKVDDVEIDLMANLRVKHDNGLFNLLFDEITLGKDFFVGNFLVKTTNLEDWFVIYSLVPDRHKEANLIMKHLNKNGVKEEALTRYLNIGLPISLEVQISNLLQNP